MASSFTRGANAMNSMFFKPTMRKRDYHKRSSRADTVRESSKLEREEANYNKNKGSLAENDSSSWVPHERTRIYYPKGQEKVMDDIPSGAAKVAESNFFN
ncbi:hypothetical protein SLA2020_328520 [Shorea laevis]